MTSNPATSPSHGCRRPAALLLGVLAMLLVTMGTLHGSAVVGPAPPTPTHVDAAYGTSQEACNPPSGRGAKMAAVGGVTRPRGHVSIGQCGGQSWDSDDVTTLPPQLDPDVALPMNVESTPAQHWLEEPLEAIQTVELRGGYRLVLRVGANHTVWVGDGPSGAARRPQGQPSAYITDDACLFHPRLAPLRFAKCVRPALVSQKWLLHSFPPVVYNPLPCRRWDRTTTVPDASRMRASGPATPEAASRGYEASAHPIDVVEDADEVACGCFAPVAAVQNVFLYAQESPKQPLVPRMLALTNETRRGLMAIDRTSTLLNLNRCFSNWGDHPRLNGAYHRAVDLVARKRVDVLRRVVATSSEAVVVEEAFYATDNVLHLPGHALDAVLEGMAQYYDAGLHRRRVPWLVAHVTQRRNFLRELLLEVLEILAVGTQANNSSSTVDVNGLVAMYPTVQDPKPSMPFVRRVWFANARHGFYAPACYTPFLANVLYPAAMVLLRRRGQLPESTRRPSAIAMLKLRGADNVASAYRALQLTPGFVQLCDQQRIVLLNQSASIAEKLFYLNTAELLVTNYGGTASFASLLRLPRGGRVLMLIMGGSYTAEFEAFVGHRVYVGFSVTMPVVAAQTKHAGGFPFFGFGLRTRYLVVQSLEDVTTEHLSF